MNDLASGLMIIFIVFWVVLTILAIGSLGIIALINLICGLGIEYTFVNVCGVMLLISLIRFFVR